VLRVKQVSVDEAKRLGLYNDETVVLPSGLVEIPHWRHALINFPHPLLKQVWWYLILRGSTRLQRAGADLADAAAAQAVLFVLGADTGVTRSDLAMCGSCSRASANVSAACWSRSTKSTHCG